MTLQERINECKLNKTESLNLVQLGLTTIPEEISEFIWLKRLYLSKNKLTKINGLEKLTNITELGLYENQLKKIEGIENLVNITDLDLSYNKLTKIEGIENFVNIKDLDLSRNKLTKIESLENLVDITDLDLSNNNLTKIAGVENLVNLIDLNLSYNNLTKIESLEKLVNITSLNLHSNQLTKIEGLEKLVNIANLDLSNNYLTKIEGLENLVNITNLDLHSNQLTKIEGLENLVSITYLILVNNNLTKIEGLEQLVNVTELNLSKNNLTKIEGIENLVKLTDFDLSFNKLTKIEGLEKLVNITYLDLGNNNLTKIEGLEKQINVKGLYLIKNQITKIDGLSKEQLLKLDRINLLGNLIDELPEEALTNTKAIIGYLESKNSIELVSNKFLKGNILGEGRIGKTQLLNYLNNKPFVINAPETHGTNTISYNLPNSDIKIILWDFGGQSYHHGFHQIFIRDTDFNLVLWANRNLLKPDYGYWLGTSENFSKGSPTLLIQNAWETSFEQNDTTVPHKIAYPDSVKLEKYKIGLDSVFNINIEALHNNEIKWKLKHDFFLSSFHEKCIDYVNSSKTFAKVPKEYIEIKEKLEKEPFSSHSISKSDFKEEFAKDLDIYQFETLLFYLQFTGNILFFHDNYLLNEYIFPDPPKLSKWIYEDILNTQFQLANNGVLDFNKLVDNLGEKNAWLLREILVGFNLLFVETGNENNLVIPQFLPERNDSFKTYLLDLIPYTYTLRFSDFIHEGRIFQFISEYGGYANDNSSYWQYGIIFTKSSIKAMVYYDKNERLIKVHLENKKGRIELAKEIFFFFAKKEEKKSLSGKRISVYAKENKVSFAQINDFIEEIGGKRVLSPIERLPLEYQQKLDEEIGNWDKIGEKIPTNLFNVISERIEYILSDKYDLFDLSDIIASGLVIKGVQLSTNGSNYFDVKETLESNNNGLNIGLCVDTKQKLELDYLAINMLNMDNHKLPKVFISYSRDDFKYKEVLKTHLSLLERYELLEFWECSQIKAGKWHEQIQNKLEEADVLVFMVSANFMSSNYIMEEEVKKGIEMAENDPKKKIICILVGECIWNKWDYLEEKYKEMQSKNPKMPFLSMNLSKFQFLPYHEYKDQFGDTTKQEILSLEQWGRHPYNVINVAYKQIVSKILDEI